MWDKEFPDKSISQEEITPWLLAALYQLGGSSRWTDAVEKTREIINVSNEILKRIQKRKNYPPQDYFESQCQFSCSILRALEHIKPYDSRQKGIWELTDEGAKQAKELIGIDNFGPIKEFINSVVEKYQIYRENKPKTKQKNDQEHDVENQEMENEYEEEISKTLPIKNDLETIVARLEPYQFEQLCLRLLTKMGADMEPTPKSHDHGIDGKGVITTGLLSFRVVVQFKRYEWKNTIGEKLIRELCGSVGPEQAATTKFIFITTSQYTKAARKYAKDHLVHLIDGIELIKLMKEYKVGYKSILNLNI